MSTDNSPGNFAPSTAATPPQPSADRDSIYCSRERYRLISQRTGPMSIQYLLIDSHHNEIVATYPKMSEAMDHRDRLGPVQASESLAINRIAHHFFTKVKNHG
jgi:hypothetical protein